MADDELSEEELEQISKDIAASIEQNLPFDKYVSTWGPLNWDTWIGRLHKDPMGQKELSTLVKEIESTPAATMSKKQLKKLLGYIRRYPALKKRVESEYGIQKAHLIRAALYGGDPPYPEVKSKEWKLIHDRIEQIMSRHAKGGHGEDSDYFLVGDEVGETGQKIELSTPDVLTPALLSELRKALAGWKNEWCIIIQFDFETIAPDLDPGMLVLWEDRVEEFYENQQYRTLLQARFKL